MKTISSLLLIAVLGFFPVFSPAQKGRSAEVKQIQSPQNPLLGFVIHGGWGGLTRASLSAEKEKACREKLEEALMEGYRLLQHGKTSVDAVEASIKLLEDSALFNAGRGAAFSADGSNELDASIMDGKTLGAGGGADFRRVKNPISLARAVMEKSPNVMVSGDGAEVFAKEAGVELASEKYFFAQDRWDNLQQIIREERARTGNDAKKSGRLDARTQSYNKYGSVGAVALDKFGNLAAGTSGSGATYKKFGRISESAIIGAGTYANNMTCAVSVAGDGEYLIRLAAARDIAALMEYSARPVQQASDMEIQQKLTQMGGEGGAIVMDKYGNIGISFNSEGMFRAYVNSNGKPVVEIYKN
jgi:L-asparaginase / beta-aspartyl-peptidase